MKDKIISLLVFFTVISTGCNLTFKAGITEHKSSESTIIVDSNEMVKELDLIIDRMKELKNISSIEEFISDYKTESKLDISSIYFGNDSGKFYTNPHVELPEDYKFYERPVYTTAVKEGKYAPKIYKDFSSNRNIKTIAKPVSIDGNIIGVVGIDVYVD